MDLELINKNCSGIYVVSFNMEKPMVYHQPFPSSNKLIDKTMIKVGKCKNIKKRMGDYRSTYGFREKEPPRSEKYWISKGYENRYLRKCLGCDKKEPHHHVNYLHIEPTEYIPEDSYNEFHNNIEQKISDKFGQYKVWSNMEYFKKEISEDVIQEVIYLAQRIRHG